MVHKLDIKKAVDETEHRETSLGNLASDDAYRRGSLGDLTDSMYDRVNESAFRNGIPLSKKIPSTYDRLTSKKDDESDDVIVNNCSDYLKGFAGEKSGKRLKKSEKTQKDSYNKADEELRKCYRDIARFGKKTEGKYSPTRGNKIPKNLPGRVPQECRNLINDLKIKAKSAIEKYESEYTKALDYLNDFDDDVSGEEAAIKKALQQKGILSLYTGPRENDRTILNLYNESINEIRASNTEHMTVIHENALVELRSLKQNFEEQVKEREGWVTRLEERIKATMEAGIDVGRVYAEVVPPKKKR